MSSPLPAKSVPSPATQLPITARSVWVKPATTPVIYPNLTAVNATPWMGNYWGGGQNYWG